MRRTSADLAIIGVILACLASAPAALANGKGGGSGGGGGHNSGPKDHSWIDRGTAGDPDQGVVPPPPSADLGATATPPPPAGLAPYGAPPGLEDPGMPGFVNLLFPPPVGQPV